MNKQIATLKKQILEREILLKKILNQTLRMKNNFLPTFKDDSQFILSELEKEDSQYQELLNEIKNIELELNTKPFSFDMFNLQNELDSLTILKN